MKNIPKKKSNTEPPTQTGPEVTYATNPKSGFSLTSGFWSIFIPAYCYFFGYTSFKCQLSNLGFDVLKMPTAPGDVYFQAFVTFAFLGDKSFSRANEQIFKQFSENWMSVMLMSIAAGIFTFIILWWSDVRKRRAPKQSASFFTLTQNKLMAFKALVLALFVFICNFLIIPTILLAIVIGGLLSIPPVVMGMAMATEARKDFKCVEGSFGTKDAENCSLITLKNGKTITGEVFHMDDKNLYILTESAALSLPTEQIDKREKKLKPLKSDKG